MNISSSSGSASERFLINADWLLKLRWVAVIGQLTTIGIATGVLGVQIHGLPLGIGLAVTALTNGLFAVWLRSLGTAGRPAPKRQTWNAVFASLMLLDLVVLTLLLYFTGGVHNPFIVFFFVNLALCGILLPPQAAWGLTGISIASYALLSFWHLPLSLPEVEGESAWERLPFLRLYDFGALVAFATCAIVIVYFTTRLTGEVLRNHEVLRQAELLRGRAEKWEALGTLAAGAAHELSTPLGTIKIVIHELRLRLEREAASTEVLSEMEVVQGELQRCRTILDRMSIEAGHMAAERQRAVAVRKLISETIHGLGSDPDRIHVTMGDTLGAELVSVPLQSLAQALRSLVQNALDADPEHSVRLTIDAPPGRLRICVVDHGRGMSAEELARCDEPFFTTKPTGRGMGLGRFLARTVVERLGGTMETVSQPGEGTRVCVQLPMELNGVPDVVAALSIPKVP